MTYDINIKKGKRIMQYNKENIKMPNITQEDNSQELFYTKQHKNCVRKFHHRKTKSGLL
jgi:hypothetical protein